MFLTSVISFLLVSCLVHDSPCRTRKVLNLFSFSRDKQKLIQCWETDRFVQVLRFEKWRYQVVLVSLVIFVLVRSNPEYFCGTLHLRVSSREADRMIWALSFLGSTSFHDSYKPAFLFWTYGSSFEKGKYHELSGHFLGIAHPGSCDVEQIFLCGHVWFTDQLVGNTEISNWRDVFMARIITSALLNTNFVSDICDSSPGRNWCLKLDSDVF